MVSDLDIWRSAKLLVDRHGHDAPVQAAMKIDEMLDRGDLYGQAVWKRTKAAVDELLDETPTGPTH